MSEFSQLSPRAQRETTEAFTRVWGRAFWCGMFLSAGIVGTLLTGAYMLGLLCGFIALLLAGTIRSATVRAIIDLGSRL